MMYKALLIAVNEQRSREIDALPNTLNDVTEIKRLLTEEPAVFKQSDVLTLSGNLATKSMINHALKGFFSDASSENVLFLYWAGHGGFDQSDAYFIPYDADVSTISNTSINMSDVKKYIDETPAQTVLSFFDTCHSGALLRGTTINDLMKRGLDIKGSGKFVVAACTEDQSAWDRGRHGAFTDHLIRGLEGGAMNPRGEVDIYTLYSYVSQAVSNEFSDQHPVLKGTLSGAPIIIKHTKAREHAQQQQFVSQSSVTRRKVDESGDWFLLGDLRARHHSYRYNSSTKTYSLILKATSNARSIEMTLKQMLRTVRPFAIEDGAEYVQVEDVDVEVIDGEKTINLTLVSSQNRNGHMSHDMTINGIKPDDIAKLRIERFIFNQDIPSHVNTTFSGGMIYGTSSEYPVSDRLIPELLEQQVEPECIRLYVIAVLVFKSILSEVNEVSLIIQDNTIVRITINGNRPRIYSNEAPSNIMVDHPVTFPM
ncbi:caspase family protein [Exiguobacterium undae]|uniref:Peptidase C14 caspase domain-containing protein n=1 Tax=Exiguobacterium undae TaxID=169177 RepID=A0ABX2V4U5_9BACL|nr:caspase family protein [Exiguobacterium undae]OAN10101.1 hypothetical protein A3783_15135 [Exiguobacterium undae]